MWKMANKMIDDWVKRCITWEVEGIRQRMPEKDLVGLCYE